VHVSRRVIVPTPWRLVEDQAVILGRDGCEVQLGRIGRFYDHEHEWIIVEYAGGTVHKTGAELDAIVPVVLPDMGRALGTLFAAFPDSQILQITDI
jgi:hypothetical protein